MDFNNICRTCLSRSNLNPIVNGEIKLDTLYTATGIKIRLNDGYPQNICSDCIKTLQHIIDFRRKCKDVETKLVSMKNSNHSDNTNLDRHTKDTNIQNTLEKHKNNVNSEKYKEVEVKIESMSSFNDDDDKPLIFLTGNTEKSDDINVKNVLHDIKDNSTNVREVFYDIKGNRVTCKLCQKNLSKRSFNMHMVKQHPGSDHTRVKCELCDDYVLLDYMKRHLASLHGTDSFKCRYCKSDHSSKESLVKHVANCTVKKRKRNRNTNRELTECDVCNKKMQVGSLRVHKAIKHDGMAPVCEHCNRRFGNKFRLNEHYRAKHGYEKLKCSYCDFQSAAIVAMRNHERRHRGEKPFVCETCGAKFHAAYLLAQHRQSHRTDKIFKCPQCPAAFKANSSLHTHRRACHGASRVSCAVCARAFSCRHYAVKHMRAVHRYSGPVPPLQDA